MKKLLTAFTKIPFRPAGRRGWPPAIAESAKIMALALLVTAGGGVQDAAAQHQHGANCAHTALEPAAAPAGAPKAKPAVAATDDHGHGEGHDDHSGHDHGPGDGHSEEGAAVVHLSAAEQRHAGLGIAEAAGGSIAREIRLSGQVVLNRDQVAHVTPQVPGVALEILAGEGDAVAAGQVLALLESSELGEAKLDYLTKINEIFCCQMLLPRARAVHDNTLRLLKFLETNPSLGELGGFAAGEAGERLTTLVGAYAELARGRQDFEREQRLHQKQIASEQDYFAAKTEFEKAAAGYRAACDSAAFEVRRDLAEAEADLRAAEFAARTAEQRLRIMGLPPAELRRLEGLVLPATACAHPNCNDCRPGLDAGARERYFGNGFAKYEVRAPIAGHIVERHLARGEKVGGDTDIFTIADTGTVWAELAVHLKDLAAVRVGAGVTIRAEHSGAVAGGRISMLAPTVDEQTRTATARVVMANADGAWPPGIFVTGLLREEAGGLPVVVPREAVQLLDGRSVVFVPAGDGFAPLPVQTGRNDQARVEIVSGLAAGSRYVAAGAFELKAKLVTGAMDSHAGHGH